MLIVGNDVVDLDDPRVQGKASDTRFLERIFTEEERAAIVAASDPDLELWQRWAAKETAYKAVSKLQGTPPVFAHRAFVVTWCRPDDNDGRPGFRSGSVQYESTIVDIEAAWDPEAVHVVGWVADTTQLRGDNRSPSVDRGEDRRSEHGRLNSRLARLDEAGAVWSGALTDLEQRLTPRELDAVHSRASLAVRIAARASIAEALSVDEHRIEIVCAPGKPGRNVLSVPDAGGERREQEIPGKASRQVEAGTSIRIETPGGGGWGAPDS